MCCLYLLIVLSTQSRCLSHGTCHKHVIRGARRERRPSIWMVSPGGTLRPQDCGSDHHTNCHTKSHPEQAELFAFLQSPSWRVHPN